MATNTPNDVAHEASASASLLPRRERGARRTTVNLIVESDPAVVRDALMARGVAQLASTGVGA